MISNSGAIVESSLRQRQPQNEEKIWPLSQRFLKDVVGLCLNDFYLKKFLPDVSLH